nr:thiamine pyrophosphate-binding protein [Acidiphilium sp. AL]
MSMIVRGSDVVIRTLLRAGTQTVFTLSGNHIMSIFDAAIGQPVALIHARHEAAAVSMADAYARMSGSVGIALVSGGTGHVNALGALCTARAGETTLLLLSGHASLAECGNGAFQELDQAALAAPLTKASWTVRSVDTLADDLATGIRIARSGRPGPVHISLPNDILEASAAPATLEDAQAFAPDRQALPRGTAAAAIGLMRDAERPLVIAPPALCTAAGRAELERLSRLGVPVIAMESPRGLNDPSLGAIGALIPQADLIFLLGKALDFTLNFGSAAVSGCHWIVIDPEAALLDRADRLLPEQPVLHAVADPIAAIDALLTACGTAPIASPDWCATVAEAVSRRPTAHIGEIGSKPNSALFCTTINEFMKSLQNPIFVSDGGEIGQWAQALISAPDRIINGVAGAIGPSIPFAIGAKAAAPDRPVLAVLGDGTFGFHMAEFETAVRHGLAFVAVIGNDGRWNAEYQLQLRQYGSERAHGCELGPATRYDAVVAALGGYGERVTTVDDLTPALQRAFASGRPACLNVLIEGLPAPKPG